MDSIPGYDAWKLATPPEIERAPDAAVDDEEAAYREDMERFERWAEEDEAFWADVAQQEGR